MEEIKQCHAAGPTRDAYQVEIILPYFQIEPQWLLKPVDYGFHKACFAYFILFMCIIWRSYLTLITKFTLLDQCSYLSWFQIGQVQTFLQCPFALSKLCFRDSSLLLCFFWSWSHDCIRLGQVMLWFPRSFTFRLLLGCWFNLIICYERRPTAVEFRYNVNFFLISRLFNNLVLILVLIWGCFIIALFHFKFNWIIQSKN